MSSSQAMTNKYQIKINTNMSASINLYTLIT